MRAYIFRYIKTGASCKENRTEYHRLYMLQYRLMLKRLKNENKSRNRLFT